MAFNLSNFNDLKDKNHRTLLHHACYNGDIEQVKYLIKNDADLNKIDIYGKKSLCTAIYRENIEICKILLNNGQDINEIDSRGRTRLHRFSCKGSIKKLDIILKLGGFIEFRDFSGKTPIFHAAISNNYNNFEFLISKGCDFNTFDFFIRNVLFYNIFGITETTNPNDYRIFNWCIKNLDNLYKKDYTGCSVLFYAIFFNNLHLVSKLFFAGLDFHISTFSEDPFISCRSLEMAKLLLILGADSKKFDRNNNYTNNNLEMTNYIENWELKHKKELIKQVNIIRNWWIDIYYSPYHRIGIKRLHKSYLELFK